ncbi:DUF2252 family protein [Dankookia sp. P2]|uniref:DUF2252 family protein n=1 Tax=Dankookia sp. P2 TaxID=3423955 RepID=UPI003D67D9BD
MPRADIIAALDAYDAWLGRQCAVIPAALARKRALLAREPFAFLRGTAFRFAAQSRDASANVGGDATGALPAAMRTWRTLGTWRDAEGRLVWGVNDLDEAAMLPFAADLVRLATSAMLARADHLPKSRDIAATLLRGYARHLAEPCAFVLDEENAALRAFVSPDPAARAAFWAKLAKLEEAAPPAAWKAALLAALPPDAGPVRFAPREAGIGSLGRPRYVAIAAWRGGRVVREAKSRVASAWLQAGCPGATAIDLAALAGGPTRAPDPWFRLSPASLSAASHLTAASWKRQAATPARFWR